jgi:hypothetical protein
MNKIKFFAIALAVGALSFSCSDDDNENPLGGDFTARWNPVKTVIKISEETFTENYEGNEPGCDKDYIEFTDDNQVRDVIYFRNASDVCTEDTAANQTYQRNDNTLTISGGEYGGTYEIIKLTNSELQIQQIQSSGGIETETTVYFTKAPNLTTN